MACRKITAFLCGCVWSLLFSLPEMTSGSGIVKRSDDGNPLQPVVEGLVQDVTKLKADLQAMQNAAAKRATFRAEMYNADATANAPIHFTSTYDVGGGYDQNTGIYTLPISGVYSIQCQLFPMILVTLNIDIMVNGNIVTRSRCYDKAEISSCLSTYIGRLSAGDKVWIVPNSGGPFWTGYHSFFAGVLVRADL